MLLTLHNLHSFKQPYQLLTFLLRALSHGPEALPVQPMAQGQARSGQRSCQPWPRPPPGISAYGAGTPATAEAGHGCSEAECWIQAVEEDGIRVLYPLSIRSL